MFWVFGYIPHYWMCCMEWLRLTADLFEMLNCRSDCLLNFSVLFFTVHTLEHVACLYLLTYPWQCQRSNFLTGMLHVLVLFINYQLFINPGLLMRRDWVPCLHTEHCTSLKLIPVSSSILGQLICQVMSWWWHWFVAFHTGSQWSCKTFWKWINLANEMRFTSLGTHYWHVCFASWHVVNVCTVEFSCQKAYPFSQNALH